MNEALPVPAGAPEPPFPGGKPAKTTKKADEAAGSASAAPLHTPAFARDLRVLVVEQNSIIALAAEDILLRGGASSVRVATTQAEALQHLAVAQCDVALVDLKLDDGGGPAIAAQLLLLDIPFAFTADFAAQANVPSAFMDRMVIDKPYNEDYLMSCLARLLGHHG